MLCSQLNSLTAYCQGFAQAGKPWPLLPLTDAPEVAWWQQCLADRQLQGAALLAALERAMPQLRLPQIPGISRTDLYKASVLRGEVQEVTSLAAMGPPPQWDQVDDLRLWIAPHPCGAMPVLLTPNAQDFAQLVRALAHRAEPVALANGVHAQAISGLIHWGLIERYGRQSRAQLIVLHEAPYGSIAADQVPGHLDDQAWLKASSTLRLEHELTHLATNRLLGERRLNLLDELSADCMGMVAALGQFSAELFGRCLGIDTNHQPRPNGRWLSYTQALNTPDAHAAVHLVMARGLELEAELQAHPQLLRPEHAMQRLCWLSRQRLDQPISAAPTSLR